MTRGYGKPHFPLLAGLLHFVQSQAGAITASAPVRRRAGGGRSTPRPIAYLWAGLSFAYPNGRKTEPRPEMRDREKLYCHHDVRKKAIP